MDFSGLTTTDLVMIAIGVFILLIWLIFYLFGRKNADLFLSLEDEDFPFKDLYFVGDVVTQARHLTYRTDADQALRRQLAVLYGTKNVDYYCRAVYASRTTMALTIACFALPVYCFAGGSVLLFIVILGLAGFAYYYYGTTMKEKLEKRQQEMLSDFSEAVSKLALLVNAGMVLHDAWKQVAFSDDTEIYQEMQKSVQEMQNGRPETEAISAFGQRCMLPEIKKFATTLVQGVTKGNAELSTMLKQQSKEVWSLKQQIMRRKGELANNQLLLPTLIVFIGILIMVVVPIFSGIGS